MLVAAKCTQCGANIQVDSTHEAGICPHCGTAFITEKAVNNYNNTYVTNNTYNTVTNINGGEVHIHGDSESADQLFQKIKDTIEGADDFSIDVFDGVTGALRKNIETFEKKFPLDARNKEIDVLIHLRQLRDACGRLEKDASERISLDTQRWQKVLDAYKRVNAEGAARYRANFLELFNHILSKMYNKPMRGEMFELKCGFYDFGKTVTNELKHRKDIAERSMEERDAPAKSSAASPQVRLSNVQWPNFFDQDFVNDLSEGKKLLSDPSLGYDGEFLLYLFECTQKALCSPYLNAIDCKEAQTALADFSSALCTALHFEDRSRASVKKVFYECRRAEYEPLWTQYVSSLVCKNTAAAERLIRRLAFVCDSGYAYTVYRENFKEGLFGKTHYKQRIPDRDAKTLCERALEKDYQTFSRK